MDLRCAADNTCKANASLGQPCLVNGDGEESVCFVGTCDTTVPSAGTGTGTCKAVAPGAACVLNADCGPNALCAPGGLYGLVCTPPCF